MDGQLKRKFRTNMEKYILNNYEYLYLEIPTYHILPEEYIRQLEKEKEEEEEEDSGTIIIEM